MRCPSCLSNIHAHAETCPHCDCGMQSLDDEFGAEEKRFNCLDDCIGNIGHTQIHMLHEKMRDFERKFPQLFLAIHVVKPVTASEMQRYGLWMLNRGIFGHSDGEAKCRNGIILLLIAPELRSAVILTGALVEPLVSDRILFDILCRAHSLWQEGFYADGCVEVINGITAELKKRAFLKSVLHPFF